jgi:nardilysin
MEVTEDIPKPERDARLYRRITFPNGLEALLISDPSLVRAPSPDLHA